MLPGSTGRGSFFISLSLIRLPSGNCSRRKSCQPFGIRSIYIIPPITGPALSAMLSSWADGAS